ncbi:MAG: DUF1801 domain-containing protein [Bacteroidota bacterium]
MNSVEEYISLLPDDERLVAARLRSIILETSPKFTEKLSYGVPYFYINSRVCFIWPASSPLSIHKQGVQLGFCRGNQLSNSHGIMNMADRKVVGIVLYNHLNEINEDLVKELLFEAIELDALVANRRRKK